MLLFFFIGFTSGLKTTLPSTVSEFMTSQYSMTGAMPRVRIGVGMRQNVKANLDTGVDTNKINVWETVK